MKSKILLAKVLLIAILLSTFYPIVLFAQPNMQCYYEQPIELVYDRVKRDYSPNPFRVKYGIINTGDSALRCIEATISYNKNDLTLIYPLSTHQPVIPSVINPNDTGFVEWELNAKQRAKGDSVELCISTTYENFYTTTCCRKIWIPPTQSIINCKLSAPKIGTNTARDRYIPMPFILTADISNDGGLVSDSLFATINFSPDLKLTSIQNNNVTKVVTPYKLFPGQHGTVTWELDHPVSVDQKDYIVTVCVRQKNIDSTCCEIPITIPALGGGTILSCYGKAPNNFVFDSSKSNYTPNPFDVTIGIINTGGEPADSVRATIIFPSDLVLDPPNQPLTKFFNPMKIDKWQQGMPANELTWSLRETKFFRSKHCDTVQFKIEAMNVSGPIDPVFCSAWFCLPVVPDQLSCRMYAPEMLLLDSTKTKAVPDTFIIRTVHRNVGGIPYGMREAYTTIFNGPGVYCISPNPITLNTIIQPHDSLAVEFQYRIDQSRNFRVPRFLVGIIDEEGNRYECWVEIPIQKLEVALTCFAQGPDTIHFNPVLKTFSPNPFVGEFDLFNAGGDFLNNVEVEVTTLPPEIELLEPALKTIPVIAPSKTEKFTWQMQLSPIGRNLSVGKLVRITVSYESDGTPRNDQDCFADIFIEANPFPTSVRPNQSRTAFYLEQNYPNPFSTSTTINFNLTSPRRVFDPTLSLNKERETVGQHRATLKVFDVFGREVLDLSDRIDNSKFIIENFQLPNAGIYFYRLTIGKESQTKMMMFLK